MTTRAIDINGDWVFGHGIADYKTEKEELEQNIKTQLNSWKNDCFFDMDAGVDWYNYLGSFGRENDLRRDIINNIMSVDGVISVASYDAHLTQDRKIVITAEVDTIYGKMNIQQQQ